MKPRGFALLPASPQRGTYGILSVLASLYGLPAGSVGLTLYLVHEPFLQVWGWHQQAWNGRLDFGKKYIFYMIFIVAVITVFAAAQDSYIGRQCGRLIYSMFVQLTAFVGFLNLGSRHLCIMPAPAQDAMVWHKTTFHAGLNDTTRYTWVPSSEVEGAWDEILSGRRHEQSLQTKVES